jgi:Chaperone of endosialidase
MAASVTISNTFATQSGPIPLSQLDANFTQLVNTVNNTATYTNYAIDTGAANAYAVAFASPATVTYAAGLTVTFKAVNANTTASTLNVNSLGTKSIVNGDGSALASGQITAGSIVVVTYDGTNFQLVNDPSGEGNVGNLTVTGNLTLSGGTANGVLYLNGSKVATSGSALSYNGTTLTAVNNASANSITLSRTSATARDWALGIDGDGGFRLTDSTGSLITLSSLPSGITYLASQSELVFKYNSTNEGMRLTSTGLGIGTSSPSYPLHLNSAASLTSIGMTGGAAGATNYKIMQGITAVSNGGFSIYDLTNSATRFVIDSSGNLGIGTTSPNQLLHIEKSQNALTGINIYNANAGGSASAGVYMRNFASGSSIGGGAYLSLDSGNSVRLWNEFGNPILFGTNGTERMRLDSSGNLGLGVTPSAWGSPFKALDMTASAFANEGTVAAHMTQNSYHNGTNWIYKATNLASRYLQYAGQHIWYTAPSGTAGNAITFTQAMTLNASGYLGIGTTNPLQPLVVSNGGAAGFEFVPASNIIQAYNRSTAAYTNLRFDCSQILFYTGTSPTESARIDSSGNLLVGTTALPLSNGRISSSTPNTNALRAYISGTSQLATAAGVFEKADNNTTTSNVFVQFTINAQATGSGQINANGANAAAFGSFSDRRLKENIVDLPPQLAKIMALRPVEFDYIEAEGGGHQISFIAQEFEQVYPDAVGERADGMLTLTGWGKTEARLVKAMQEQQALIESLTARLNALENK